MLMDASNARMYAIEPILSKTLNDPQYRVSNFGKLPNFGDLLLALLLKTHAHPL
jgi:hypothetical protein